MCNLFKRTDGKNGKCVEPEQDGTNGADGKNGSAGVLDRIETRTLKDSSGKEQIITVVIPGTASTNGTAATMGGNSGNVI